MALVQNPLETLDWVGVTGVATTANTEGTILSTDVITASTFSEAGQGAAPQQVRPVIIDAVLNITAGTGTTAVVIRCRQGTGTGGTQVGNALTDSLAAGASEQIFCRFRDFSGVPFSGSGTNYTITIQQTGGTAAGTVNTADVEVRQ